MQPVQKPTLTEVMALWPQARQHPQYHGCVGHWGMVEGAGPTLLDLTGGLSDGTLNGGTSWSIDREGPALSFDGVDDYVEMANEPKFDFERTQPFSVSFWFSANTFVGTALIPISKLKAAVPARGWEVRLHNSGGGNCNALNVLLSNKTDAPAVFLHAQAYTNLFVLYGTLY